MDKNINLIIYASSASLGPLQSKQVMDFCEQHQKKKVSMIFFGEHSPEYQGKFLQSINWRDALNYEEMFPVWHAAYSELNKVRNGLPTAVKELININYHDIAYDLWKRISFSKILIKQVEPTIYILPIHWNYKEATLFFRLKKKTYSFFYKACEILCETIKIIGLKVKNCFLKYSFIIVDEQNSIGLDRKKINKVKLLVERKLMFVIYIKKIIRFFSYEILVLHKKIQRDVSYDFLRNSKFKREESLLLITVEDSGTGINLQPAKKIAEELRTRRVDFLIISSSEFVLNELRNENYPVTKINLQKISISSLAREFLLLEVELWKIKFKIKSVSEFYVYIWMNYFSFRSLVFKLSVEKLLRSIKKIRAISSLATIYEALPLSIAAGNWCKAVNVPWIGFFPVLVGDRPDAYYFPASIHLVYGEQLRKLMLDYGCKEDSVIVTGSPTFDEFIGRDALKDLFYCHNHFPGVGKNKIVVVATEAFPDPFTEIGPVLESLITMDGIYIVIKVHPSDSVEFFKDYVSRFPEFKSISVIGKCNLPALLHAADLLIAIVSNIIVSAAVMGTPTLVCDFSNKRRVIDFVALGLCDGCFNPDDLNDSIRKHLFDPETIKNVNLKILKSINNLNGDNDGNSASRIVDNIFLASNIQ